MTKNMTENNNKGTRKTRVREKVVVATPVDVILVLLFPLITFFMKCEVMCKKKLSKQNFWKAAFQKFLKALTLYTC